MLYPNAELIFERDQLKNQNRIMQDALRRIATECNVSNLPCNKTGVLLSIQNWANRALKG